MSWASQTQTINSSHMDSAPQNTITGIVKDKSWGLGPNPLRYDTLAKTHANRHAEHAGIIKKKSDAHGASVQSTTQCVHEATTMSMQHVINMQNPGNHPPTPTRNITHTWDRGNHRALKKKHANLTHMHMNPTRGYTTTSHRGYIFIFFKTILATIRDNRHAIG